MLQRLGLLMAVWWFVVPPAILADEPASGLLKDRKVSTGREDVASKGFEAAAERLANAKGASELRLAAGGLVTTGNARSTAGSLRVRLRVRRGADQLFAAAAGNYGQAAPSADAALRTTVQNVQARGQPSATSAPPTKAARTR